MSFTQIFLIFVALVPLACSAPGRAPEAGPDTSASRSSPAPEPFPESSDCPSEEPLGTRAEMTTPVGATTGPRIDEPVFCGRDGSGPKGAYIRVYGSGTRRLAMGNPRETGACVTAPAPGAPPDTCPLVAADAVGDDIFTEMVARGLAANGVGLGVCGESTGSLDFDAWRFSVGVTRWGDADAAIQIVSGVLRRWGVGHHFGVSVRGIDCAVPL